jgi:hypothetical protein
MGQVFAFGIVERHLLGSYVRQVKEVFADGLIDCLILEPLFGVVCN